MPEVSSIQVSGTPAPFNFNGVVRHYCSRQAPELGSCRSIWPRAANAIAPATGIALELRERLKTPGTLIKVVEVPTGPPVLATLLAELSGPDSATAACRAGGNQEIFASVPP